ncbi:hypothetical protein [Algibacter sp. 2305UL17-15]|uniref:hypothetical protein n=1 Tax=Algibacter sp. 2305UL17-15 TaxID=3231268 RepID=UPI00345B3390
MKRIILIIILVVSQTNLFSQTKKETYDYLNEKLEIYKLEDIKINYIYKFQEVQIENENYINLIVFCTLFSTCTTAYLFQPKNYSTLLIKEKDEAIWVEIHCKPNSIESEQFDLETEKRHKGDNKSKMTIILDKNTPVDEINKIKKAFIHLLKLYGVEKKDIFD